MQKALCRRLWWYEVSREAYAETAEIAENQSLQLNAVEWLNQCSYNLRFQLRSALQSVVDQIDFDQFSEAGNRTSWVLSSKPCSQQEHKQI